MVAKGKGGGDRREEGNSREGVTGRRAVGVAIK